VRRKEGKMYVVVDWIMEFREGEMNMNPEKLQLG